MPKSVRIGFVALGVSATALLTAILGLYSGLQAPLSSKEAERYLNLIESQTQKPGGRHDLPALRRFLHDDDGMPFYTVNLYEFNDHANYANGRGNSGSGREAFERFSEVMLRLLADRYSHPVFGSQWADAASSGWDRIVVVRYRSRRDLAEIFANPEFADASAHKWAALKRNDRMLVQSLHIPELHLPLFALAALVGTWTFRSTIRLRRETMHAKAPRA